MNKLNLTEEQEDAICDIIGQWYLMYKDKDLNSCIGRAKEHLRDMICGVEETESTDTKCDRCKLWGQDRRTLYMRCMYNMDEFNVPFKQVKIVENQETFHTLTVCKNCRGAWMGTIEGWFNYQINDFSEG